LYTVRHRFNIHEYIPVLALRREEDKKADSRVRAAEAGLSINT